MGGLNTPVSGANNTILEQGGVDDLREQVKSVTDTLLQPPETTTGVIDRGTHLEVGGWKVSKENLGEPTLPKGEIEINAKIAARFVPQAWSKEINGKILWFYNYEGAKREIEHRGQYFPSGKELLQMVNSVSGNCKEKAKALGIPPAGRRYGHNSTVGDEFCDAGGWVYLWSSASLDYGGAPYVCLRQDHNDVGTSSDGRERAFSVRSFLDNTRV